MQSALRRLSFLILITVLIVSLGSASAQTPTPPTLYEQALQEAEIEANWQPDYLSLATGDPDLLDHGVYEWPFALDSIGHAIQSYQYYGGEPYFHHGTDIMKFDLGLGTQVFNRSGGQVVNIENYQPGWDLYWEVAILDPDGYLWQYHHIHEPTIPDYIYQKYTEYQADPVNGGFIDPGQHIGNIIEWPVWSFGKQFNHIHLNIIAAGNYYVTSFEFHNPLPDTVGPEIQTIGLLKNGQPFGSNNVNPPYSLYVRARDLVLDDVYYLPPYSYTFSIDGQPEHTTWQFDQLPGTDRWQYLYDFYVIPPTCGDYDCRDFYVNLGFIPDSQYVFPTINGVHHLTVTVCDYAGNCDEDTYNYGVNNTAPIANPQSISTFEDISTDIILTGSDINNDPLTFTVVTPPTHGDLSGTAPNLTYTPDPNYNGTDIFTFRVNDGLFNSNIATVSINIAAVNDAPVLDPIGNKSVLLGETLTFTATGSDVDNGTLMYALTGDATGAVIDPNTGVFTWTPTSFGSYTVTIHLSDGSLEDTETIAVIVTLAGAYRLFLPLVLKP
jgi:hypothetical protein